MPRLQFVTARERDLGAGIDQQSAENQLQPGYCEDIENADPKSTGQITKRRGYQGYAGYVPVRVTEVNYDGTDIELTFDESIELPLFRSSPIIVLGQTSVNSGDFASESIIYFDNFTSSISNVFLTGSNTLSIPADEHGTTDDLMFVNVVKVDSVVNTDNSQIIPDNISITKANSQVDISYLNNTGSEFDVYVYTKSKVADPGNVYISSGNTVTTGTYSLSILAATHALNNNNIIARAYRDTGTEYEYIDLESVVINSSGDVTVTVENNTGATFDMVVILSAVPTANFKLGNVGDGQTSTVTIDISGTDTTAFPFIACYLEQTPGGDLEQVIPESVSVDIDTSLITVTFTNNSGSTANFELYYEFGEIKNNKIKITGTASATFTDTAPQLTVWGLCHEEIYGTRVAREGWVNHIDSYRAPGENKLICGLGGNLFSAESSDTAAIADTYLMPTVYPSLNHRITGDLVISPVFHDTGQTPGRTRGFITGDNSSSNFVSITAIAYNSGTGYVEYTLNVPNMVINGTLSTIISTISGLEDRFTAQQCGYSVHNGTFVIKTVSSGVDTIVISVENSAVTSSDYNETDVGGFGGVFTDQLLVSGLSNFLTGDKVLSDVFNETDDYNCVASASGTIVIDGVVDTVNILSGIRITGQRTSSVIPIRDSANVATVENIVRGDNLIYSQINRQLRVKSINQLANTNITINSTGGTATVTLDSGDTTTMFVGKKLLILGTSNFNGVIEIASIESLTTFTFDSETTGVDSGRIQGNTVEVDEELEFFDLIDNSITIKVAARWIPIESPTDNFDLTPETRITYFDSSPYESQNIIRSTMVQDNLYLTNDADEVMKYDGTDIYRAGLFRWQPHMFVSTDTTVAGKIVVDNVAVSATVSGAQFTVGDGEENRFAPGDIIQHDSDGAFYTVNNVHNQGANGHVAVNSLISGGAGNIRKSPTFNYYFRLNAVDANNNVIASAVTGSEDFAVRLGDDAAVNIKLVGMPAWDIYDYDRLEVQIYRTKSNGVAPFYLLTTLPMLFDNGTGYILYTDSDSDEDLINLDNTMTALKGAELGTGLDNPPRAKYCTTAGNRLVLGNLKDYPQLDIQILQKEDRLTSGVFLNAANKDWLFRKDNTDTATTTDMLNRVNYEFVSSSSTVNSITGTLNTSFSVNVNAHGLFVGDWVYLFFSLIVDSNQLTHAGLYQVNSVTDANNFVVLDKNSGSGVAPNFPDRIATATNKKDVPVYLGNDGNYSMVNGNRDSIESYTFLAIRRLANMINASMRQVDVTISGYEDFEPWMIGNAGNEYQVGQLVIRQPKVFDTTLEVTIPSLSDVFSVFVNNIKRAGAEEVSSLTKLFPSRLVISYPNYPEIFDNINVIDADTSDSVIDVNSADGQEITAIIPFFGDAAFGAAQKSGIVVVFKTNSIYLIDINAKAAGTNAVQRLETRGKGCTAPYSVAVTKGGIIFANDTGIYRLGRDLKVDYIGRKYERKFKNTVNISQLELATGHHDTEANSYKLSYPLTDSTENSEVAVYNHTREYENQQGAGSWTTYTNHPVTGWTNLESDSFFSATTGRVFIVRKLNEVSDYRDDDQGIAMSILTRAMDMGESGKRKVFSKIITHYRTVGDSIGTELKAALNLRTVFQDTDSFEINQAVNETGVGDEGDKKVITIVSVINEKVGIYLQLQYLNSTIDETVEITGIDIRVAAKSSEGIIEAAET